MATRLGNVLFALFVLVGAGWAYSIMDGRPIGYPLTVFAIPAIIGFGLRYILAGR